MVEQPEVDEAQDVRRQRQRQHEQPREPPAAGEGVPAHQPGEGGAERRAAEYHHDTEGEGGPHHPAETGTDEVRPYLTTGREETAHHEGDGQDDRHGDPGNDQLPSAARVVAAPYRRRSEVRVRDYRGDRRSSHR